MNTHNITKTIAIVSIGAGLLAALPVAAQNIAVSANINVTASTTATTTTNGTTTRQSERITQIVDRSDKQIDARIKVLNDLATRIQGIKNISDTEKAAIATEVQTKISGLTALKAKIDAGTDVTVLLQDEKSILGSFRIYALIIPQGYILGAADRINTVAGLMTSVGVKLQARITALQGQGKDVTALQTALADFNAKITVAQSESVAAKAGVAALVPDNGDKTKADANHAALIAARAHIKTGTKALQDARKDANTILKGIKVDVKASATSTTSNE